MTTEPTTPKPKRGVPWFRVGLLLLLGLFVVVRGIGVGSVHYAFDWWRRQRMDVEVWQGRFGFREWGADTSTHGSAWTVTTLNNE